MKDLLQSVGHDVIITLIAGVVTSGILLLYHRIFRKRPEKRSTATLPAQPNTIPTSQPQVAYAPSPSMPLENSQQATWALILALISFVLWFVAPLLVLPAIALSLWFGFAARRSKNGAIAKAGLLVSAGHIVLFGCIVVVLVAAELTQFNQPTPFSPGTSSSSSNVCVTSISSCYLAMNYPSGASCFCTDGFTQYAGVVQ